MEKKRKQSNATGEGQVLQTLQISKRKCQDTRLQSQLCDLIFREIAPMFWTQRLCELLRIDKHGSSYQ